MKWPIPIPIPFSILIVEHRNGQISMLATNTHTDSKLVTAIEKI